MRLSIWSGRIKTAQRSMEESDEYHVLMTLLGVQVTVANVTTFKTFWEKRKTPKSPSLPSQKITLYKLHHQMYLKALCNVIKKYGAIEAYFPAPHEIEIILPFVCHLVEREAIQYFKTGVYQSLFGYDKSKCTPKDSNEPTSYELTDDWHVPGQTESGKPAFFLVCIYLFMVAMNVRAESAGSIEKAIKVKITERLPIPLSFSKLFEKDEFKENRAFFVKVFNESEQVVEYRGKSQALAAYLESKFTKVKQFCVTLYTNDTYTDLMKAPDVDLSATDTFKEGTGNTKVTAEWRVGIEDKLYSFLYTHGQVLLECDLFTDESLEKSIAYLLHGVVASGDTTAEKEIWTMHFHGHPRITYTVATDEVVQDLVVKIKRANSAFEVKQLFSKENVCNILRKKATNTDRDFKLNFDETTTKEKKLRWYCETLMSQHITLNATNAGNAGIFPSLLLTNLYDRTERTDAATEAPFFDPSFIVPRIFGTSAE